MNTEYIVFTTNPIIIGAIHWACDYGMDIWAAPPNFIPKGFATVSLPIENDLYIDMFLRN
ncbi:hypothetical protein D3C71_1936880 [compost metagenome]